MYSSLPRLLVDRYALRILQAILPLRKQKPTVFLKSRVYICGRLTDIELVRPIVEEDFSLKIPAVYVHNDIGRLQSLQKVRQRVQEMMSLQAS